MQMMGTDTTEYDSRLVCRMETLALLIKSLSLPLVDINMAEFLMAEKLFLYYSALFPVVVLLYIYGVLLYIYGVILGLWMFFLTSHSFRPGRG